MAEPALGRGGARQALRRVRRARRHRLRLRAGERLGLIGPNGSGKSTLVNCLLRQLRNETGSVRFDGRPRRACRPIDAPGSASARSFQLPRPFRSLLRRDNLRVPLVYTVDARGGARLASASRRACDERSAMVGLEGKAAPCRAT